MGFFGFRKNEFGDMTGNFWLGLEKIHQLARPGNGAKLRREFKRPVRYGTLYYAKYSSFSILSEADGYRLAVGGFTGNVQDSFGSNHNNKKFSTFD